VTDRIKLYMDEHVAKSVTEGLRRRGVDVVTVQELGLQAAEDQQHLQRAGSRRRCCGEATAHRPHGSSSSSLEKGRNYLVPSPTRLLPSFAASEERIVDAPS
jgi:hypothetical protein